MESHSHLPLPAARAAARLLAVASAIGGSVGSIAIGTGGLVGATLLPPEQRSLATLPVTAFVVGSTLAAVPSALAMRRVGRRAGFVGGAAIGAVAALAAAAAISAGLFWTFCLAMIGLGAASSFGQQYRFAAADAAPAAFKPKAISWVLAGGIVTGVVGPQVSIHARALMPDAPYAGPYAALAAIFVVTALILSRLVVPPPRPVTAGGEGGRPLGAILLERRFLTALLSATASYALMTLVMTASPLAMIEHGHDHADTQHAIQWHVIAMFAPSFFTGSLIARFGKSMVAAAGLLIIALAATVALTGTALLHFYVALVLLGLGWNFGFIASTAMVAELYRPQEAFRVQAANEFLLFGLVALASFGSGKLLASGGWDAVNLIVFPIVAVGLMAISADAVAARRAGRTLP
ncbi:MFS transporter [Oharaeibacter diazotrophicus]|uniref:Putative MFS family arabinose efflux permease n=2 Tax=Oharaeibacter diazotrophicus TaxID=1920512 RepID=A0A4R6RJD8_9HYPH|nr:MFS transporter [Oharaeibacter diazotrophicus]TDP86522.1 putative MFS family arabinose efflux permease [Oharaeibacter diazotrophicus]BBE71536.1 major facilitator superfamily protein [Pleomorphomonas sp. SM30]GLS78297.1 MFS transporter [Oharaeibacter diazotrophicus]